MEQLQLPAALLLMLLGLTLMAYATYVTMAHVRGLSRLESPLLLAPTATALILVGARLSTW